MEHTKSDRRLVYVLNPAAGKGKYLPDARRAAEEARADIVHLTERQGECIDFIANTCLTDPDTHFVVYGGDGTVAEAANGIIRAGAGNTALLSIIPAGTGNDFVRSFPEKDKIYTVDALKYGDRYAANIINFGFDSRVVAKTALYKKAFPGSAAYLAGVADTFFRKIGERWQLELEDENGQVETFDEEFTLALAANCQYYGGGFRAAPLADPSDGLLDFMAVTKVTRPQFLRLIGEYKKGTHLDPVTERPYPKFEKIVTYRRCKRIRISGIHDRCADGEIEPATEIEVSVVPGVLRIAT